MTRTEPPSSPPQRTYCALCERVICDDDEYTPLRTGAVVCGPCWRATPRRGRNKWG